MTNIIVLPLFEGLMVLGIVGSIAAMFVVIPGKLLLIGCALLIGIIVKLTAVIAALPASSVNIPNVGLTGGICYYLFLFWLYGYLPQVFPKPKELFARWPYKSASAVGLVIICFFVCYYYPRPLQVHFIDVGQGDATFIRTPHGYAVLIDSGGSGDLSDFDVGDRVVVPYLKHYNVSSLDYLFLTHGHKDHAGGAASVATAMPVRRIYVACEEQTPSVQALAHVVKDSNLLVQAVSGQTIMLDGVEFRIEHAADESTADRGNEASNVIRVSYGNYSFLITGDLGAKGEKTMLDRGLLPGSVLKVAHHGAKTSTTPEFLNAYAPQYAVISVGYSNQFGHPHPETLERLAAQNIKVYRTDVSGAVVFSTNGEKLMVETFVKDVVR